MYDGGVGNNASNERRVAMSKEDWHYPRRKFAEKVFDALAFGPIQGLKVFGPRRTGKTEFLTKDLAPLVEERGHKVVYVDFWQKRGESFAVLLRAFDQAFRGVSILERVKMSAEDIASKIRFKVPGTSVELEVDPARLRNEIPMDFLDLIVEYCDRLADKEKPAFLLFDEFQELAKAPYGDTLIAVLRSSLVKHRYSLVAVFSGSSQDELQRMFNKRTAPFFAFASNIEIPSLTDEFVDHQIDQFRKSSSVDLGRNDALEIFNRFKKNPMIVQKWLMHMAFFPDEDKENAVHKVLSEVAEALEFDKTWHVCTLDEKIVARLIADGLEIYGEEGTRNSQLLSGQEGRSSDEIMAAVERLNFLGVAVKNNGDWVIGDDLFGDWVRERAKDEFHELA